MESMDTLRDLFHRLEQLNEVGAALSQERNINRLLENILIAAKTITHADGGTLYRMTDDREHLRFEIMRTDTLGIALGGTTGNPINLPDVPLKNERGEPNSAMVAAYAAINDKTVNIADAYSEAGFDFSGTRKFDTGTGYRSKSFLTVPMKNHENHVIGVLQLINAIDPVSWSSSGIFRFRPAFGRIAGIPGCHCPDQPAAAYPNWKSCLSPSSASSILQLTRSRLTPAAIVSVFQRP
jgi:hypothetical protein